MNFYKVKGFWLFRMEVTSAKPKLQVKLQRENFIFFYFNTVTMFCLEKPARDCGSSPQ